MCFTILPLSKTKVFKPFSQSSLAAQPPDIPEPTSYGVTGHFKFNSADIAIKVIDMLGKEATSFNLDELLDIQHDVPNSSFTGPF